MREPSPVYALTLIGRELRADLRRLGLFLACLALGAGAIAGVGSLAAATLAGIGADARALLGGDVEVSLANRPLDAAARKFLAASGKVSAVVTLQAMARTAKSESPIALKAVDRAYPLYGRIVLDPPRRLASLLSRQKGRFGAVAGASLLDRLRRKLGGVIRIGNERFVLRAVIAREPDPLPGGLVFGPRVIVSRAALAASGLLVPGTLATYRYRVRLPAGTSAAAWVKRARAAFPKGGWRIRTSAEAAPQLRRLLRRVALFLRLIAFLTLLVGGIGIANAVESHLAGKRETIATLKCLGAASSLIFCVYLGEVLALALLGIALGLLFGALLPFALRPFLSAILPAAIAPGLYPAPLVSAFAAGLFAVLAFSIFPLARVRTVPPSALFRAEAEAPRALPPLPAIAASALAATALFALAVLGGGPSAGSGRLAALYFAAAAFAALLVFAAFGRCLAAAARRSRLPRLPALRLALQNLARPNAPAPRILLSLGLSLSFLIAVALIENNLFREIVSGLPARAPSYFFIDIAPAERASFAAIVKSIPGARVEMVPMLRGRITKIDGVRVEKARIAPNARWAVDSDRGLTYASQLPKGSAIAAGTWWPAKYRGPPLVSMSEDVARGMGLRVGDTISVDLLGREITARIANLRRIDWSHLGINFVLVFSPGALEGAPQTDLAAVTLPRRDEALLLSRVTRRFPDVSAIPVREALKAVAGILRTIGRAVRVAALSTLLAGTLVLAAVVASSQRMRTRDAVLLKVLGATRADIARIFLIEHAIIGVLAALLAAGAGSLAARLIVTRLLGGVWVFFPGAVLGSALFATVASLLFGFAATLRALGKKPAAVLRGE